VNQDASGLGGRVGLGGARADQDSQSQDDKRNQVHAPIVSNAESPRRDNDHIGVSLKRLRGLAWLLDNSIRIPGTRIRFGLDPVLGLIPGLGDAAGTIMSSYILIEGNRLGVSRSTLLRMTVNVLLELVAGAIPLVGDLFDAGWKANQRNIRLLERSMVTPDRAHRRDRGFVAFLVLGIGLAGLGLAIGGMLFLQWLF
jgi:hypothetical protein